MAKKQSKVIKRAELAEKEFLAAYDASKFPPPFGIRRYLIVHRR